MESFWFAMIVLLLNIVIGSIFDNLISPRIFGDALGVHPASRSGGCAGGGLICLVSSASW